MWWKIILVPDQIGFIMKTWAYVAPFVSLLTLKFPQPAKNTKIIHMAQFLVTGAAIGVTLSQIIRYFDHVWLLEIIWLPIGIFAAVIHYSSSQRDEYL